MEWIKCSDRMPYIETHIIFFAANKFVLCGKYHGINECYHHVWESDEYIFWDDEVTHWMPLPDPPEVTP